MRTVCTLTDVDLLERNEALPPEYISVLRLDVVKSIELVAQTLPSETSLEDHGPIFVFEVGDNVRCLPAASFPSAINGILGLVPEHVEKVSTHSFCLWRVLVVLTNGYAPTYWIPVGMDEAVDIHLEKYLDLSCEAPQPRPKALPIKDDEVDWI